MDPLALLARDDKWFLSGGKGALYAPPFPKHLLAPGFWDESYLADVRVSRLFTAIFSYVGSGGLRFQSQVVNWRPDRLILEHRAQNVFLRETRCVLERHAWVSELELVEGPGELDLFLWSLQDYRPRGYAAPWSSVTECLFAGDRQTMRFETAWPAELTPDRTAVEEERTGGGGAMLEPLPIWLSLGADRPRVSQTVNLAQRHDDSPLWETSMVPSKFVEGMLPGDFKVDVGTGEPEGLLHLVQHYRLPPGERIQLVCAAGLSPAKSEENLETARADRAADESAMAWRRYFSGVPQFSSSDPWLTSAYWYRWYGLRLNTVDMEALPIAGRKASFAPFVSEGIGFFRNFITYSAQAHLREVAWMHDSCLANGILQNLGSCQRKDGSFPGHNYSSRPARDFYHADFATGVRQVEALHGRVPDGTMATLRRYADYLVNARKHEVGRNGAFMLDILDQNETGQEYMSRYQAVSDAADQWGSFRVGGVDASVYGYLLFTLVRPELAKPSLDGITYCYDGADEFFCDVTLDGGRSAARPATGFYALLCGSRSEAVERWLLNPDEFWLPKGFPATAASDDTFSAVGEWKEQRLNCPWNGRSWPMVNSHVVDALASASRVRPELHKKAAAGLMKTVRLMFHDGDPRRPNSYEHYDPVSGRPALYRGYDDYMHSWIVDLIMRHAVGVQPGLDEIDPLPLEVDWIECTDIPHPRGRMDVRLQAGMAPIVKVRGS